MIFFVLSKRTRRSIQILINMNISLENSIQNKFLKRRVLFRLISIQFYLVTDSYHKTNLICYSTMVSDVSYNLREVIVNTKYNVVVLLCIEISAVLDSSFVNIFDYCFPEIARLCYELAIGISVAHLLSFLLCALICISSFFVMWFNAVCVYVFFFLDFSFRFRSFINLIV
jgi:hypothetical protein